MNEMLRTAGSNSQFRRAKSVSTVVKKMFPWPPEHSRGVFGKVVPDPGKVQIPGFSHFGFPQKYISRADLGTFPSEDRIFQTEGFYFKPRDFISE